MQEPSSDAPVHVHLRRVDASRNMRRFYSLDIVADLFGGFLLLRRWGRIGARGQVAAERYDSAAQAMDALRRRLRRKTRRGYVSVAP
ncbi:MAG: WGR domain-containing protein [Methylocystis sp.]|uniref:WGR domain-containing protein n=1 Tax=Methylocystis sp. TaxID=1911079 RepID=UPI003DA26664